MIVLLRLTAGLIGWAAAFCLIYALHGLGCGRGWDSAPLAGLTLHRWALAGAWAASAGLTLAIALWLSRGGTRQLDRAAMITGWVGFGATIVTFAPTIVVPTCL